MMLVASCEARLGSLAGKHRAGCRVQRREPARQVRRARGRHTVGVEPTGAYEDALGRGHAIFNDFFSEDSARTIRQQHGTHRRHHVHQRVRAHRGPAGAAARARPADAPRTRSWWSRTTTSARCWRRNQFDTFYHEHPRTYSLTSFVHIAGSLGRAVAAVEFPSRYGGNIRVTIGKDGRPSGASPPPWMTPCSARPDSSTSSPPCARSSRAGAPRSGPRSRSW